MDRIHCSYHKCLTVFFRRVMVEATGQRGYRHYNSLIDEFASERRRFRFSSVNNHAIDVSSLGRRARISRFVRDPRDLVVSGYFYHRSGAEPWCLHADPTEADWQVVNGTVPAAVRAGESYADCLRRLDTEDGIIAEIEWRTKHFDSMRKWPENDRRVRVWRYEDIVGHEATTMAEITDFYELSPRLTRKIGEIARRNDSAARMANGDRHVRDPKAGQWKEVFTPRVTDAFMSQWGDLLPLLGYE